jgi:hypothetical protein
LSSLVLHASSYLMPLLYGLRKILEGNIGEFAIYNLFLINLLLLYQCCGLRNKRLQCVHVEHHIPVCFLTLSLQPTAWLYNTTFPGGWCHVTTRFLQHLAMRLNSTLWFLCMLDLWKENMHVIKKMCIDLFFFKWLVPHAEWIDYMQITVRWRQVLWNCGVHQYFSISGQTHFRYTWMNVAVETFP